MGDLLRERNSAYGESDDEKAEEENEEEDEENEEGGKGRMLGFMFGNVDDAGDLDEEYLDQDAKEHLSALADQLGPSLVDLELSTKRKGNETGLPADEEQEDYATKADNAVDYEDIQEEYDGPEVQVPVQDEPFYAQAALAVPFRTAGSFVSDEDNYDEDDENEEDRKQEDPAITTVNATSFSTADVPMILPMENKQAVTGVAKSVDVNDEVEETIVQTEASQEEPSSTKLHQQDAIKIELPVLCQEDGKEVLRFSELFGVKEPYWVLGSRKGRPRRHLSREIIERAEDEDEALEEDEEEVFTSRPYRHLAGNSVSNLEIGKAENSSEEEDEEEGSFIDEDDSDVSPVLLREEKVRWKAKKIEFYPALPMKSLSGECEEIVEWRENIPEANFVAVHQQEWEANILWEVVDRQEGSRSRQEVISEVSVEADSESEQEIASSSGRQNFIWHHQKKQVDVVAGMQNTHQWNRPIVLEPLSRPVLDSKGLLEGSFTQRHPQMLRLESLSLAAVSNHHEGKGDLGASEVGKRLSKLSISCSQRNRDLASGSWLDSVLWNSGSPGADGEHEAPKVIYDLQDRDMVFEIPNSKQGQLLRVHAAAVVLSALGVKDSGGDGLEVVMPSASSVARFNISNDKYYTNKKTQHQQKSHAKKRAVHGVKVMHSLPAIKLQTMKPKLTNKDLANFHRPKAVWYPHHNEVAAKEQGKLAVKGPMKVILKTLGGKGSKLYVDASETLEVLKVKAAKKMGDLKASEKSKVLYSGKELEEGRTFAEQQVPPNSVLHLVRTRVYPWPKAQRLPGENKPIRPPGAFKKKSELSVKDGHVALMEYCEERPLLLSNVGMGARLSTYYRKLTPTDSTAVTLRNERGSWVGFPLPLEPTEDSPFLGDIRPGDTVSSLETNMYRSPAFGHKVAHTDFLLVRSAKGKLSLRRIDSLHVIGQQEPHLEVLTPTSKTVQNYIGTRLLVYVYREFRNNEKPASTPRVRADELISQFPSLTEGFIRKRLKHCADLQKGSGGEMWWVMRRNFRIPSEEELRRMVTPEMVCTYESMQAGLHHLKRMGVQKLTQSSGLSGAMNMLPDEAITLAAASHIERELQITPWNLSSNFVSATLQGRGSLERLEITGAGDPSGRGLGFSYLRVATKPPNVGAIVEKKAAVARGGGAVTGTDADLRRLSMDAAREVLLKFKVSEAQIDKLTRWHRIALVRKLSSEQAASLGKVGVAALNKFARGQRMSFLQLQQQTREKCQEIWDRQVQSLAAAEGEDSESDGEANGDLDSFAGDLENLLEAEEGEDGEVRKGRREGMRGLGARRRALQAQKEEEMEDEEAEAAELRRMLLEDDEAEEEQKKKKTGNAVKEKKVVQAKEQNSTIVGGSILAARKKKRVLKRIIRTKKSDGTFTSREIIITDPKEVAAYLAKKTSLKVAGPKTAGDVPKKGAAKPKKEKKVPLAKDLSTPKAPVKKVTKEGVGKEKPGRDGLRVVCGACGQLGHMRTNKKCPLYMEDAEGNLQRHDSAAAEGLLERQGTKITIKKKKIDELQLIKPSNPAKLPRNKPVNSSGSPGKPVGPPVKIPALKIKIQPAANLYDAGLESNGSKVEGGNVTVTGQGGVNTRPSLVGGDVRFVEGNLLPPFKETKVRVQKKHKKKKMREKAPLKRQQSKKVDDSHDQLGQRHSSDKVHDMQIQADRERQIVERAREEMERQTVEKEKEDMKREQLEKDRSRKVREQKKKDRLLERQRDREVLERQLKLEKEVKDREEQKKIETQRLKELREKKKQRIREEKERVERQKEVEVRLLREEIERQRQERLERDRLEQERLENERLENERLENERLESERLESERLEKERLEKETLEREIEKKRQKLRQKAVKEDQRKERLRKEEKERILKKQKEDKIREKTRQAEKLKVREQAQPIVCEKMFRPVQDLTREPKSDKKEKGRVLKKRIHSDLGSGPQRAADPPKRQRTRGGGEVDLANMFEAIVNILVKSKVAYLFVKPVSKKDAPDYLNVVKKPMDLGAIREKARMMQYRCRDDFRMDVELIVTNAHEYNDTRNPGIPPLADALLDLCDQELRSRKLELEDAEDAVERFEDDCSYTPSGRASPLLDSRRRQRTH